MVISVVGRLVIDGKCRYIIIQCKLQFTYIIPVRLFVRNKLLNYSKKRLQTFMDYVETT